jgi:hypothetical protein
MKQKTPENTTGMLVKTSRSRNENPCFTLASILDTQDNKRTNYQSYGNTAKTTLFRLRAK